MSNASYRTIMRSSSIMGGAQAASILANILKMKALALLLGPLGVGLAGLYVSLIQTASTMAALGLGTAGTRQVAGVNTGEDDNALRRVRATLFRAGIVLAVIGGLVFWLASDLIAGLAMEDESRANEIGWLAVGVGLTVAASAQTALLSGLRRIGYLARIQAFAGVSGAALGVIAIWQWGEPGIVAMVLVVPAVTLMLGHFYARRVPQSGPLRPSLREMVKEFGVISALGVTIMLSQMITLIGHLAVRVIVQRDLGVEALGHFQAAWAISIVYVGFVLAAMGTDYFPRLSAAMSEPEVANRLVNEQTEVALLLCGPVLLATLGLAPWIVPLLYSDAFGPTVEVLRWQIIGDILKVVSWPLGFVLLAAGAGKTFAIAEFIGISVLITGVTFGLPILGVSATGLSYLVLYIVYLPLILVICGVRFGITWHRPVIVQVACVFTAATLIVLTANHSEIAGGIVGAFLAGLLGLWSIYRINSFAEAGSVAGRLNRLTRRITDRIKR